MESDKVNEKLVQELHDMRKQYDELKSSYDKLLAKNNDHTCSIKEREDWFRMLYEHTSDGIMVITLEGQIIKLNHSFAQMHGYLPEEMTLLSLKDIDVPVHFSRFAERSARLKNGETLTFEVEHYHKDGHIFPLEVTTRLISIEGKDYITASHRDITLRKMTELELQRAQQSKLHAMQAAQLGFWYYDIKTDDFIFNEQVLSIFGFRQEEVGGPRIKSAEVASCFFHPADSHIITESLLAAASTANPDFQQVLVARPLRRGEQTRWLRIWYCIEKDAEGETAFAHGVVQDITPNKIAEGMLSSSENTYKLLYETMRDCFVRTDKHGSFVEVNSIFLDMLGYTKEEIMQCTYEEITPEKWWKYESDIIGPMVFSRGYSDVYEKEYIKKDGTIIPVELRVVMLQDEQGKFNGSWAFVRDITARKAHENALIESEERYRTLIEMEPDAIFMIDNKTGQILEANSSASAMYGYTYNELTSMTNSDISEEPQATKIAMTTLETVPDTRLNIPTRLHRKKNGEVFPVSIHGYSFVYQGRSVHMASIRDITEQKNAEARLLLSTETYRGIIDSIEEAVYIQDSNGNFLDVNKSVEKLYGYDRKYFIGKSPEFLAAPGKNDFVEIAKRIKLAFQGSPQMIEFWGLKNNGKIFPKEVSLSLGNYFGQKVIIAVARDISERKNAEDLITEKNEALSFAYETLSKINSRLEESEHMLRESQKVSGHGSYKLDFSTGIWTSSEVLDDILGFESTQPHTIEDWVALIHPDWKESLQNYISNEVIALNQRFDKEYKIFRQNDQKEIWVHGLGEIILDEQQKPQYMAGSVQDITLRKKSEETLTKIQSNLTALIENTTDLIWAVNEHYQLIVFNQTFVKQVKSGYDKDIKIGDFILFDSMPEAEREEWRGYYDRALQGERFSVEKEGKGANIAYINFGFYPIRNEAGNIIGGAVSGRDISMRRKLELQMIQSDRMYSLGEMAASIAHEINQPLNNISMTIDNILFDSKEKQIVDKAYIERKSHKLFENIARMRNLVDHIRLFARGHEDAFHTAFNVNEAIKNSLSMISQQLSHKEIGLVIQLDKNLPDIDGNIYNFEQVVLNLLLNARDAMEEKKTKVSKSYEKQIRIVTKYKENSIYIEIEDNGCGIEKEKLEQVFLPFYSTKEEGKGTGLGLSISLGIIKEMNGQIMIDSEKNKYTRITIALSHTPYEEQMAKTVKTSNLE